MKRGTIVNMKKTENRNLSTEKLRNTKPMIQKNEKTEKMKKINKWKNEKLKMELMEIVRMRKRRKTNLQTEYFLNKPQ